MATIEKQNDKRDKTDEICQWLGFGAFIFYALIGLLYAAIVKEASFMWIVSILSILCGVLISPICKWGKNKKVKMGIIAASITLLLIVLIMHVSLWLALKHIVMMVISSYYILRSGLLLGFSICVVLIMLPFVVLGHLMGPWYWWWWGPRD